MIFPKIYKLGTSFTLKIILKKKHYIIFLACHINSHNILFIVIIVQNMRLLYFLVFFLLFALITYLICFDYIIYISFDFRATSFANKDSFSLFFSF